MGRKSASIHIFDGHNEMSEYETRKIYGKRQKSTESWIQEQVEWRRKSGHFSEASLKVLERIDRECADAEVNNITFKRNERFWSIYDGDISFETVIKKATSVSKRTDRPVVYVSCFDGDVLMWGVFIAGRHLIQYAIGGGLTEYGMEDKRADSEELHALFDFIDPKLLEIINSVDGSGFRDIVEAERALSNMLGISIYE